MDRLALEGAPALVRVVDEPAATLRVAAEACGPARAVKSRLPLPWRLRPRRKTGLSSTLVRRPPSVDPTRKRLDSVVGAYLSHSQAGGLGDGDLVALERWPAGA